MNPKSIYPVICTEKIEASRDFYTNHFDFEIVFEADWYVSLKSRQNPAYELALLDVNHASLPVAYRQPARGVLIEQRPGDEIFTNPHEQRAEDYVRGRFG